MNNYDNFQVEDWLEDPEFRRWVFHNEANEFWQNRIKDYPHQQADIEQARKTLLAIRGELAPISNSEIRQTIASLLDSLDDTRPRLDAWWNRRPLQVAAGILLVIGLGWAGIKSSLFSTSSHPYYAGSQESQQVAYHEEINQSKGEKKVELPDGSEVTLYKNSRIKYPEEFLREKREVFLLGEAYFNVKKDSGRPFFVYASEMITKVLGTSFTIRAYEEDEQVSVAVKSGKVSVYARQTEKARAGVKTKALDGIILTPNQQAVLARQNLGIVRSVVPKPILLKTPPVNKNFSFKRTPATEVFSELEHAYGVTIIFDKTTVSACSITAELGDESLFEKLDMLCTVMNANYQSIDGQIIINSQKCE